MQQIIEKTAKQAGIHKQVTPGLLRDMFVVRSVKGGMKLEDALEKIGLSKNSYDYARKSVLHLSSGNFAMISSSLLYMYSTKEYVSFHVGLFLSVPGCSFMLLLYSIE